MGWWKRREKHESDLERELRSDLELEAAEFRDHGLSGAEARLAAQRAFGNAVYLKEEVRAAWGWTWVERLARTFDTVCASCASPRGSPRSQSPRSRWGLARIPRFSALSTRFSEEPAGQPPGRLANPQLAADGQDAFAIAQRLQPQGQGWTHSEWFFPYPAFSLLRKQLPQFTDLVGYAGSSFTVTANGTTEFAYGHFISKLFRRPGRATGDGNGAGERTRRRIDLPVLDDAIRRGPERGGSEIFVPAADDWRAGARFFRASIRGALSTSSCRSRWLTRCTCLTTPPRPRISGGCRCSAGSCRESRA